LQVHNSMFNFDSDGGLSFGGFDGEKLLQGETDGSSYLNGGMRATHTAGGYTALDPTCPIFLRGDTVYVPTVRAPPRCPCCPAAGRRQLAAPWPLPAPTASCSISRYVPWTCGRSSSRGTATRSTRRRRCSAR
jgi:hypothetical protein